MPAQSDCVDVTAAERCRLASVSARQDITEPVGAGPVTAPRQPAAGDRELERHCGDRTDPSWFLG